MKSKMKKVHQLKNVAISNITMECRLKKQGTIYGLMENMFHWENWLFIFSGVKNMVLNTRLEIPVQERKLMRSVRALMRQ